MLISRRAAMTTGVAAIGVARAQAAGCIPPMMLSFMNESRRLDNRRIKQAFDLHLRYPTVFDGVPQMSQMSQMPHLHRIQP